MTSHYNNEEYSDVVIKSGQREFKCHKIIICSKSEYFKRLCGPSSRFAEAKQQLITLHDDEPDAVEALIRYLYTGKYMFGQSLPDNIAIFHLNVSRTADKYGIQQLSDKASKAFHNVVVHTQDLQIIITTINALKRAFSHDEKLVTLADGLRKAHMQRLLNDPGYRAMLDGDKELMWEVIDDMKDRLAKM